MMLRGRTISGADEEVPDDDGLAGQTELLYHGLRLCFGGRLCGKAIQSENW
jgi:hypothetical protein